MLFLIAFLFACLSVLFFVWRRHFIREFQNFQDSFDRTNIALSLAVMERGLRDQEIQKLELELQEQKKSTETTVSMLLQELDMSSNVIERLMKEMLSIEEVRKSTPYKHASPF